MDQAVQAPTPDQAQAIYVQCSKIILDDAMWIPLCLPPNSTIAHSYVPGSRTIRSTRRSSGPVHSTSVT